MKLYKIHVFIYTYIYQGSPTTLTAVAFQDHLAKSLGLNDVIGPRQIGLGPAARAKQRKPVKSNIDIGRFGRSK